MTKQAGLGDALWISGRDLSGDTQSIEGAHGGPAALDFTGIDKSGMERLGGERDGGLEWTSFFNDAAGQAHPTLSALPTTDVIATYCRGTALGGNAFCVNGKEIDYAASRPTDGGFLFKVAIQANGYGGEWGTLLTAGKKTDSAAANGTSVDLAASTSFGLQIYFHLFSFTGTSVTIKVQESSDNGAGDAFADVVGATSGALTTVGAVRAETARGLTVERYLRAVTTGTFSNAVFGVVVMKNVTSVVF